MDREGYRPGPLPREPRHHAAPGLLSEFGRPRAHAERRPVHAQGFSRNRRDRGGHCRRRGLGPYGGERQRAAARRAPLRARSRNALRSGARRTEDGASGGHDPRARREGSGVGGRTRVGAAEGRERTMTKRAASLLIGFWLLALATSASAECAWVLWSRMETVTPAHDFGWTNGGDGGEVFP